MTLTRSLKQTGVITTLFALIAVLTVSVGASMARAAGTCTRVDNADGTVTLDWDSDGDDKWAVREGTPGNNEAVTVIRDTPGWTGGDAANEYTVRYVRQGGAEVQCTAVVDPPPDAFCTAELLENGDVVLTISDNDAKSWAWRRGKDGAASSYKGEIENFTVTDAAPSPGVYAYEVVSRLGAGEKQTDQCGTITIEGDVIDQDCSATLEADGTVTVSFIDDGANRWAIFRAVDGGNAGFLSLGEDFTYTDTTPPAGEIEYLVRSVFGPDDKPVTSCGSVTIDGDDGPVANVCTATLEDDGSVTVAWDDNGARNWSVRRGIDGAGATYLAVGENFTYSDTTPPEGVVEYVIRARFAEERIEASCGTVTIEPEGPIQLVCTLTDNADGTVSVDWNDDGANKWSIRRGKNNGAVNFKGETETPGWVSTVEGGNTYTWQVVSRFPGGAKTTTDCGTLEIA